MKSKLLVDGKIKSMQNFIKLSQVIFFKALFWNPDCCFVFHFACIVIIDLQPHTPDKKKNGKFNVNFKMDHHNK